MTVSRLALAFVGALMLLAVSCEGRSSGPLPACTKENAIVEIGTVPVIYRVENGELGAPCLGNREPAIEQAWAKISKIAPVEFRRNVRLIAAWDFEDSAFAAYMTPTAESKGGSQYAMVLELNYLKGDPVEAGFLAMHELNHAITGSNSQLEWGRVWDDCPGYSTAQGCARPGSYLDRWVKAFWSPAQIKEMANAEDQDLLGSKWCQSRTDFLWGYPATHPDEDFAESFATFAYDVKVKPGMQAKMDFFAAIPELNQFRENFRASGIAPHTKAETGCSGVPN